MTADSPGGQQPPEYGASARTESLMDRIKARRKPIIITLLVVGALGFAAGWNPSTATVHSFTETSNYSARRESGCTNSGEGCHGSDATLADFNKYHPKTKCTICHAYTGVGCIPCHKPSQHECTGCHDGTMNGASDCVRLTDSFPHGHYRESLHEAIGTETTKTMVAAKGGKAKAACSNCHSKDLRQAHNGVPEVKGSTYGPVVGCAECHNDKKSGALGQVKSKWKQHRCEDCHGKKSPAPMHATDVATPVKTTGKSGCASTGNGCHSVNDVHALHPNAPATCSGSAVAGEPGCHDLNLQSREPTVTACGAGDGTCHAPYKNNAFAHKHDSTVHFASGQGSSLLVDKPSGISVTCSSCHSMELTTQHAHARLGSNKCTGCHNANDTTISAVKDSWPEKTTSGACGACHKTKHAVIDKVHTASQSGCVKAGCHSTADVRALHKRLGCSNCHLSTGKITGAGAPLSCGGTGATACHKGTDLMVIHKNPHGNAAGTKSSACVACHGATVMTVSPAHVGCTCHTVAAASPGDVRNAINSGHAECVSCHRGKTGAHGFVAANSASGHNTTTYGRRGAYSKFDGSQGPVVLWRSEIASAALSPTWMVERGFQNATRPDGITSVTVGQTGRTSTNWPFPTVNVFWKPGDPAAPADALFLNKDSVITCQDCHTGLKAAGPHGADQNWGLDPNYPGDYSKAELTKQVEKYPSGIKLRSDFTTKPTYSSGMTVICSKCHDLENYQSGTTVNNPLPRKSTGGKTFVHDGQTYTPVYLNQSGTRNDGFFVWTDNTGAMVPLSKITITGAVGSQKWKSSNPQAQAWMQGKAGTLTAATIGSSNTAHSSHHQDQTDGSPQCVNCHIGIPHAWKRPRLLVNTGWDGSANAIGAGVVAGDPSPYLDSNRLGSTRNAGGIKMVDGFNKMGMLSLSAVDNHGLWAGSSVTEQYQTGAAYWSEASCQACNDHAGEDGIRIINFEK